jgi:hypothetical protein
MYDGGIEGYNKAGGGMMRKILMIVSILLALSVPLAQASEFEKYPSNTGYVNGTLLTQYAVFDAETGRRIAWDSGNTNQKMYYLHEPIADLGFDVNDPNFKDKIINDVKASFPHELEPLRDKVNVDEYTIDDLSKILKAIGKRDTHVDSLFPMLMGISYGERRLYIVSGQPTTAKYRNSFVGYLLYKKPDGTNVLKKIRRGDKEWEIVEVKEKKPKT